jgi:hypothetical protein
MITSALSLVGAVSHVLGGPALDKDLRTKPAAAALTCGFASRTFCVWGRVSDLESESNLRQSNRAEHDRPGHLGERPPRRQPLGNERHRGR